MKRALLLVLCLVGCNPYKPLIGDGVGKGIRLTAWSSTATQDCQRDICPPLDKTAAALAIMDEVAFAQLGVHPPILKYAVVRWTAARTDGVTGLNDSVDRRVIILPLLDRSDARLEKISGSSFVHEVVHLIAYDVHHTKDELHRIPGLWRSTDGSPSLEDEGTRRIIAAGL